MTFLLCFDVDIYFGLNVTIIMAGVLQGSQVCSQLGFIIEKNTLNATVIIRARKLSTVQGNSAQIYYLASFLFPRKQP